MSTVFGLREAHSEPQVHGVGVLDLGLGVEGVVQLKRRPQRLLLVLGRVIEVVIEVVLVRI